jgi:hypothetical protein
VIVLSFVVIVVPVKLRLNHVLVCSQSVFEGTCSHISLGKHSQITFLRTFGSRRPPTGRVSTTAFHDCDMAFWGSCYGRVQPGGPMSITTCNGTKNTHKLDCGYLRELWPQRDVSRWHRRPAWGKFQILGLWWMD